MWMALVDETGQPYAYTGDDPVNGTDPLGQCSSGSWWCDAAHSIGGGITGVANCLNNSDCFSPQGLANVGAGFANQAAQVLDGLICTGTSEQTCPTWSVGSPFPCDSQGSYQVGEAAFLGVGFLLPGGDEADAGASLSTEANDAGDVLQQTVHGASRAADTSRLSPAEQLNVIANPTQIFTQADGAQVFVQEVGGKYNIVVQGNNGIVTNLKTISQSSLNRLASRYGWSPN